MNEEKEVSSRLKKQAHPDRVKKIQDTVRKHMNRANPPVKDKAVTKKPAVKKTKPKTLKSKKTTKPQTNETGRSVHIQNGRWSVKIKH
jgi:hypothetical protein